MPKATRDKESATTKKGTSRAKTESGNGTQVESVTASAAIANESAAPKKPARKAKPENGNSTQVEAVTTSLAIESQAGPMVEQRIRTRAYELYLQRGGRGGSPEQDWFQALKEICGEPRLA
jgi:Protein of unknown function (DUF2934)